MVEIVIILTYWYLATGVVIATAVYFGLMHPKVGIRWHDFDLIDPDFRWKVYLMIVVLWYKIFFRLR